MNVVSCPECGGIGVVRYEFRDENTGVQASEMAACETCDGKGTVIVEEKDLNIWLVAAVGVAIGVIAGFLFCVMVLR